ncbi:hypothetical protein [Rhabdochlamydiaceae symbiont of Dictyostelium giganteum]|uniref:hypothetical protein n=1 Tax=Rhabdochlamydiaceae symbiont of Dictyostelium giganteum TaxID=3342349 RepID=UPI00384F57E4
MNIIRITSRLMGSSMTTLTNPLTYRSPQDQIFKRFFCTQSFEKFSQKNQDKNLALKERDIVILYEGNPINGESLIHSKGRPIYIIGKLFGRLIGIFLTSQNIDKYSLQLTPNADNNLTLNSKPIFNQWISIDPKTQLLKKIGFNENSLIHSEIVTQATRQIENSQKDSSSQGFIYTIKTVNECFNVFIISNYGPEAPVHIGIKMTDPFSIEGQNKPYFLPITWNTQAAHKQSQPLDLRDINSYSHETMALKGKADCDSLTAIYDTTMNLFTKLK